MFLLEEEWKKEKNTGKWLYDILVTSKLECSSSQDLMSGCCDYTEDYKLFMTIRPRGYHSPSSQLFRTDMVY